ncbi:hypothetical protein Nepgr_005535 [Nepenthes gracilis]|uniref:Uncharacterized protein n=1 Tax=Nepenthes gracilis TaxID=150966 RepID=A0AAD3S3P1_NEPGR|nr:hypothetical protein Nepgr_005535 [Nepenthes gracilis]
MVGKLREASRTGNQSSHRTMARSEEKEQAFTTSDGAPLTAVQELLDSLEILQGPADKHPFLARRLDSRFRDYIGAIDKIEGGFPSPEEGGLLAAVQELLVSLEILQGPEDKHPFLGRRLDSRFRDYIGAIDKIEGGFVPFTPISAS